MTANNIVRTVCVFSKSISSKNVSRLNTLVESLQNAGFKVQTKRICTKSKDIRSLEQFDDGSILLSVGTLTFNEAVKQLPIFYTTKDISFNIDLTNETISLKHCAVLFSIIKNNAKKTFQFTYVFNNPVSSPFYPAANYESEGFSVGLKPTDLSTECNTLDEWFKKMKSAWMEIIDLFKAEKDFLGIDSSIAPLATGKSSLVHFIRRLGMDLSTSVTSPIYTQMTQFIKKENPMPIGLCGLMLPCLEDFELAKEYEKGNFSIERNIFISLQSGLGIDTYPIGIDESPRRVSEILYLIQYLSIRYSKPLSVRFVSDGKAKIGRNSDFKNQYLKDVIIRPL